MTPFQIKEINSRFYAARLLTLGQTYRGVSELSGLSLETVRRVAKKLQEDGALAMAVGAKNWKPDRMSYEKRAKYYRR